MKLDPKVLNDLAPVKDAKCAQQKQRQQQRLEMEARNKFYVQNRSTRHPFENAQAKIEHSVLLRRKFLRRQLITTAERLQRVRDPSLQRAQTSCATKEFQARKDEFDATQKQLEEAVAHMQAQLQWREREEAELQRLRKSVEVARTAVSEVARDLKARKSKPRPGVGGTRKEKNPNGNVTVGVCTHKNLRMQHQQTYMWENELMLLL